MHNDDSNKVLPTPAASSAPIHGPLDEHDTKLHGAMTTLGAGLRREELDRHVLDALHGVAICLMVLEGQPNEARILASIKHGVGHYLRSRADAAGKAVVIGGI